jgi:UDP-N-acetylmuramoyl-L-alanyl-D-glutamate--2,6-diaminopimelate ligase
MQTLDVFFTAETAQKAGCVDRQGDGNPEVMSLEYDSRNVKPGSLYFALPGIHADGHAFIGDAVSRGAVVVVYQQELDTKLFSASCVFIRVADSRFAMSPIAAAFYGFPAERLTMIGVTGTEGKSTTVYLIWQLLRLTGKKAGFISTVQYSHGGDAEWNSEHQTTPEAPVIQYRLAQMLQNGAEYAVIEASSHGLSARTNRLGGIAFDAAVMTNVTHEHLEFHGTWEQYRNDKANLFRSLDIRAKTNPNSFGVINADDKSADFFSAATKQKTFRFSTVLSDSKPDGKAASPHDLRLCSIESGADGNRYEVFNASDGKTFTIEDKLPGAFNAGNVLAALLVVSQLKQKPPWRTAGTPGGVETISTHIQQLEPVRGRMTSVNKGQPFEVLIDYAHTPSSFSTIFPPLRARISKKGGRIISVFGSAGERDTKKRSEQGAIAARWSDVVILTDEDPRGEDPMAILEEIAGGITNLRREETLFLIPNRPEAIRKAFSLAKSGDLALLLGKGHEGSIIYRDFTVKYDEIAEAEKALDELQ